MSKFPPLRDSALEVVLPLWIIYHYSCWLLLCLIRKFYFFLKLRQICLVAFGGCDVGAQDPHSHSCWWHIQRMGVQVDELHQGLSAEVVCPEQWAVVILQVFLKNRSNWEQINLLTLYWRTDLLLLQFNNFHQDIILVIVEFPWQIKSNSPTNVNVARFTRLFLVTFLHRIKLLWFSEPRLRWATHVAAR